MATADISASLHLQMLQVQYQHLASQVQSLQTLLGNAVRELVETKKRQDVQGAMMKVNLDNARVCFSFLNSFEGNVGLHDQD